MAQGTGVLLNNEMDDFAIKPGVPNAFGLIGSQANALAPGKRPLSSMTPTLVFKDNQPWIATGSPGGSRIITIVLQVITNVTDFGMNIAAAGAMPRMHHQWRPDALWLEQGFSPDTIELLLQKGHEVRSSRAAGRVQSVAIENGQMYGASDPRSTDGAAIGVLE
jgi:gamma-glutamyltranspeptidase/glutathione hydrolase